MPMQKSAGFSTAFEFPDALVQEYLRRQGGRIELRYLPAYAPQTPPDRAGLAASE